MSPLISRWNTLGINKKFNLSFALLLFFVFVIVLTAYLSFLAIRNTEKDMQRSTEIRLLVLQMDRGMERAHRLLGDFFLHYQSLGLQKAHEQYAQPSVRQISQVISLSTSLEKTISYSNLDIFSHISQTDVNLYLASAKRFATTSIQAVELLARRTAPDRGIEARLSLVAKKTKKELRGFSQLDDLRKEICSFIRRYQISRQRHFMQSALNSLDALHAAVDQETTLETEQKNRIFSLIQACHTLNGELLDVDRKIAASFQDFSLQKQILFPVSNGLITATGKGVEQAQQRIDSVYHLATLIILSITLITIMFMSSIAKLLNNTITGNILRLTKSAHQFGKGNMDIRASESSQDELGQLARIFNTMASQVQHLVNNLERKVTQRTIELTESEERFRHLVNDLPKIAVQGYDHERNVIYWNRASEILYGYSEQEAMGKKLEDLIIPEPMQEGVTQVIQNWYENDVALAASELILHHKDGSDVPVYSSHVMLTSSQGEKTMYCVDLGLADLKIAQAMGQKSESFYRQLFDHTTSGVVVYEAVDNGHDFLIRDINKASERIEGLNRDSVLGRKVTEVFPGIEEFGLLTVFRNVWKTGEPALHPVSFYKDEELQGWRENRVYRLPSGEVVSVYNDLRLP